MHVRLLAVGGRQPAWVDAAFAAYATRLPSAWRFDLTVLPGAPRRKNQNPAHASEQEGRAILRALRGTEQVIALDERGKQYDSSALAGRLEHWVGAGRDLCFVIGGPDGLSPECLSRASERWSLSKLTLPHGLARVTVVEQLYRASTLLAGHPYHKA